MIRLALPFRRRRVTTYTRCQTCRAKFSKRPPCCTSCGASARMLITETSPGVDEMKDSSWIEGPNVNDAPESRRYASGDTFEWQCLGCRRECRARVGSTFNGMPVGLACNVCGSAAMPGYRWAESSPEIL